MTLGLGDLAFVGSLSAGGAAYDTDAQDYINRVIAADVAAGNSSGLEVAVQDAYNAFVVGCKADTNWSFIKASCILAGAKTRAGALVPLVGAAPSSIGFVDADHDRKTGLKGSGSSAKYLNSNRACDADAQSNGHAAVYITTADTRDTSQGHIGSGSASGHVNLSASSTARSYHLRTSGSTFSVTGKAIGFYGASRPNGSNVAIRTNGSTFSANLANGTLRTNNVLVFGNVNNYTDARLSFYSLGEALNLELLEARVATLNSTIAAAIP